MVPKKKIDSIIEDYGNDFSIATICSHSSLQIFHGAKQEGVKTVGIVKKKNKKFYEQFPQARPDKFIVVDEYSDITEQKLLDENSIIIPHGSFVEYIGERLDDFEVPIFGNRNSLVWERDRMKLFEWMKKAGLRTPKLVKPDKIDRPVLVKFPGAKGGRGYLVVNSTDEYWDLVGDRKCIIQEFIIGVRAYAHYFFSPFSKYGQKSKGGRVQLLSMDRRRESNADEIYRTLSVGAKGPKTRMSFTVVGNDPIVLRESLLPKFLDMGTRVSNVSHDLFGGMPGPFCIETVVADDLDIFAFEISARIVAGTNLYPMGSPYSFFYYGRPMSTGRRIAIELKDGLKKGRLTDIVY